MPDRNGGNGNGSGRDWPKTLLLLAGFAGLLQIDHGNLSAWLPAFERFSERVPWYVRNSSVNLMHVALTVAFAAVFLRRRLTGTLRALGLLGSLSTGWGFAAASVLPLYLVFWVAMGFGPDEPTLAILYLAFISPIAEELLGRGLVFGLMRRLGWGFWSAALIPAAVMALLHWQADFSLGQAAGVLLITFGGFTAFAWFYERWGFNLWVPIGLHCLMNLSWSLFSVGESAFAGWLPTVMQITTLVVGIGLTLKFAPRIAAERAPLPLSYPSSTCAARAARAAGPPSTTGTGTERSTSIPPKRSAR